jgi:hypothetical protein
MNRLIPMEYSKQRIMTTKALAEQFGTEESRIRQGFIRNQERFIEGKHYYKIEGEELKQFKASYLNDTSLKFSSELMLWTERGAARHAKILETDAAWDIYEELEDTYFRVKKLQQKRFKPSSFILKDELQIAKAISETTGVKLGIAFATALRRAEKITGNSYDEYMMLLPAADYDTGKIKVAELGEKLGGLKSAEVNKMLLGAGLQYQDIFIRKSTKTGEDKTEKQWRLTEKGKQYAEEYPYTRNGHSGYEIRWTESVIDFLMNQPALMN